MFFFRLFIGTRPDLDGLLLHLRDGECVFIFLCFLLIPRLLQLQQRKRFPHGVVLVSEEGKAKCFWGKCNASDLLEGTRACLSE